MTLRFFHKIDKILFIGASGRRRDYSRRPLPHHQIYGSGGNGQAADVENANAENLNFYNTNAQNTG